MGRNNEHQAILVVGYSITSSARASRFCGTLKSSALAVLRLTTGSYFVGNCAGKSAGFAPLRTRSTYDAPPHLDLIGPVRDQAPAGGEIAKRINRRKPEARRQFDDEVANC